MCGSHLRTAIVTRVTGDKRRHQLALFVLKMINFIRYYVIYYSSTGRKASVTKLNQKDIL